MLVPVRRLARMFAALQLYPDPQLYRPGDPGGVAGPAGAAADGGDPTRIKRIAFGISIATCSVAGAFLIIIQPVEPSIGRDYIGRIFAICVLGGMTSLPGMVIAAMLLGIVESITSTFYGPSWAPAVAFGLLLMTLAVRPAGPARPLGIGNRAQLHLLLISLLVGAGAVRRRAAWSNNDYFFFAGYTVLQYIVLATAWNILGGYTGYMNFGTGASLRWAPTAP